MIGRLLHVLCAATFLSQPVSLLYGYTQPSYFQLMSGTYIYENVFRAYGNLKVGFILTFNEQYQYQIRCPTEMQVLDHVLWWPEQEAFCLIWSENQPNIMWRSQPPFLVQVPSWRDCFLQFCLRLQGKSSPIQLKNVKKTSYQPADELQKFPAADERPKFLKQEVEAAV